MIFLKELDNSYGYHVVKYQNFKLFYTQSKLVRPFNRLLFLKDFLARTWSIYWLWWQNANKIGSLPEDALFRNA